MNEAVSTPVQQQQPIVETPVVNQPQAAYETEATVKPEVIVKKRVTRRRVVEPEVETIE